MGFSTSTSSSKKKRVLLCLQITLVLGVIGVVSAGNAALRLRSRNTNSEAQRLALLLKDTNSTTVNNSKTSPALLRSPVVNQRSTRRRVQDSSSTVSVSINIGASPSPPTETPPLSSPPPPIQDSFINTDFGSLPLYQCGPEGDAPVLISSPIPATTATSTSRSGSSPTSSIIQRIAVKRSYSQFVCLLKQVGNDGKTLARSYNQGEWESRTTAQQEGVVTPLSEFLQVEQCQEDICILNLPTTTTTASTISTGAYELVSWQASQLSQSRNDPTLQRQHEIARFLIQSTFGPTRADIDSFPSSYEAWLHNQIHTIRPTYNREYFRARLGDIRERETPRGGDVPCQVGSRWSRFLFGFQDNGGNGAQGKVITIEEQGDYIIIKVEGTMRAAFHKDTSDWDTNPRKLKLREGPGWVICGIDGHGRQTVFKDLPLGCHQGGRGHRLENMDLIPPFPPHLMPPSEQITTFEGGDNCEFGEIEGVVQTNVLVTNVSDTTNNCQCKQPGPNPPVIFRQDPTTGDWYRFEDARGKPQNTWENPHWNSCFSTFPNIINRQHCQVVTGTCTKTGRGYTPFSIDDGYQSDPNKLSLSCGSPGEVGNDPSKGLVFHDDAFGRTYDFDGSINQSNQGVPKTIWMQSVIFGQDQLRQRMAWALNGIFIADLSSFVRNEPALVYTDIFIRNAFTNYLDLMREVTYSFAMADYLTYLDSASYAVTGVLPDENYARELLQLFTIGVNKLHLNGTIVIDPTTGDPVETYTQNDIETMARVWTGFEKVDERTQRNGNYGAYVDGMKITPSRHDQFPKMDLDGGYIGDGYPLCYDLPSQDYLHKGAAYHFISAEEERNVERTTAFSQRVSIPEGSPLYEALCSRVSPTEPCNFQSMITLDSNLACHGVCDHPTVDFVQVGAATYRYVRSQPCVTFPFFNVGEEAITKFSEEGTFSEGYCLEPAWKVSCCGSKMRAVDWTGVACTPKVHIFPDGKVSMAHKLSSWSTSSEVSQGNLNMFRVVWDAGSKALLPKPGQCAASGCEEIDSVDDRPLYRDKATLDGESRKSCLCSVQEAREPVFSSAPSRNDILERLHVGSVPPSTFNGGEYVRHSVEQDGVSIYTKTTGVPFDADTIFAVSDIVGETKTTYFRNVVSTVSVTTAPNLKFRNPPMFNNIVREGNHDVQGATNEIEAVLQYLVKHENAAPFLSFRLIQRFVTSNPSGGYVERVSQAFQSGRHGDFGTGRRGDLSATIAAVLLDTEAREMVLDADPTQGQLREPIIKLMHLFRSLEYHNRMGGNLRFINFDGSIDKIIGQFPFEPPSVFSYFRPDFARSNSIIQRQGLIAPETQVLDYTNIFQFLNYLPTATRFYESDLMRNASLWGLEGTAKQLNTLLTGGRLPDDRLQLFQDILTTTPWPKHSDTTWVGQFYRLLWSFTMSAEFSSSNINKHIPTPIPTPRKQELPSPAQDFKAIVFVDLNGGANSFSMLVPHSECKGEDLYERYKGAFRDIALDKTDLLVMDVPSGQQNCSKFGMPPNMPNMHQLYQENDLLWVSNVGSITHPGGGVRTMNSHSGMTIHLEHGWANARNDTGVLGRVADVLSDQNYKVKSWVTSGWGATMAGSGGRSTAAHIMRGESAPDLEGYFQDNMPVLEAGSSIFAQYMKHQVDQGKENAALINEALGMSSVDQDLFKSGDSLTRQMKTIARLVQQHEALKMDRGLFVAELGGFDSHSNEHQRLPYLLGFVDKALGDFASEMKRQGNFDKVAVVIRSEFGRSHGMNGRKGTNHGWNGNYFILGGNVRGGQVLGEFPVLGRRMPSHSWETIYNGLFEWMGVLPHQMSEALPNGGKFPNLFSANDLMESK